MDGLSGHHGGGVCNFVLMFMLFWPCYISFETLLWTWTLVVSLGHELHFGGDVGAIVWTM